ncbi:bifunctional hydroxymethylpyrimidine kinase/phosphomethylpyrimidine kinase [Sphingomonas jatrophae]|uniref:hydroxymethylpyrimidine kinase n=1 Tax=Sphingomonas jatrophae TaxID=1166337 RepID=A0A1I6JWC9_9SPHN|nr:bifunctional hydroxymethylpyrimidine kinase/phosphomethylpyrimidine kinase [Sphingomonas jatrophae]SFR83246.1 hydroxymethylpyrimidine/phosphomethylpyrimidine kinase [Sphingomonas jatrophae]
MIPRILVIAGSDSGGGAGIQADIKTVMALGGFATTAITAITAQNTLGVTAVHPLPPEMVTAQIDAVLDDIGADAVKIGMLGSAAVAEAVHERLATRCAGLPIVVDPVLVATSGAALGGARVVDGYRRLFDLAALATPNVPELATLSGDPVDTPERRMAAGGRLASAHGTAILAKGGDAAGDEVIDILCRPDGAEPSLWRDARIDTRHTHGTGCTLASAIATGLGRGEPLEAAIARARSYVRAAMLAAPGFGAGHGPMGHAL